MLLEYARRECCSVTIALEMHAVAHDSVVALPTLEGGSCVLPHYRGQQVDDWDAARRLNIRESWKSLMNWWLAAWWAQQGFDC